MRRNEKIIRMSTGFVEDGSGMFPIYPKTNPCYKEDTENDTLKNQPYLRTAIMRTKRN